MDCRLELSDSENELFPTNVYTYQNESTKICAKGPNVNTTNITGISFRNNALSSTMQIPRNFERSRFLEPSLDQRSMCYRRETSPMSMYSGSGVRSRNVHQSYYHGAMSSQRSMYNGRSGSPMSMRSMDSNVSVSANDIAFAFKNVKFNKFDLKIIKDAYNKLMKRRVRQKIEKRRNMRLFLKGYRRKSGYDSGEQGSDSSISSDDCRSTSSAFHRNMSSCRSTRTNISELRQCIKDTNMYKDCSENLLNSFKNNLSQPQHKVNSLNVCLESVRPTMHQNSAKHRLNVSHTIMKQNESKLKNGFLLPSQRFNKSVASIPIDEMPRFCTKKTSIQSKEANEILMKNNNCNFDYETDEEEIFSQVTIKERSLKDIETNNNEKCDFKRHLDKDAQSPKNKKAKISKNDDFQFLKPQCPLRKSGMNRVKEKLITKSAAPLADLVIPRDENEKKSRKCLNDVPAEKTNKLANDEAEDQVDELPDTEVASEVAMRPSFIKRKLYTQKMDVIENKKPDGLNSPQTDVYTSIQREKHKARKLVTNQSCLNRDVNQEDSNLLDLIHKIVPPDQMNITNITNKTSLSSKNSQDNKNQDDDRWDVTSVISTCNNDNVSDTYTDEEIFNNTHKTIKNKKAKVKNSNQQLTNQCKVLVDKLTIPPVNKPLCQKNVIGDPKKSLLSRVKTFWDTDFESDVDSNLDISQHQDCYQHRFQNQFIICTSKQKENQNISKVVHASHNSDLLKKRVVNSKDQGNNFGDQLINKYINEHDHRTCKSNKGVSKAHNKVTTSNIKSNIDSEKILRSNRTPKKIDCCDNANATQDTKSRPQQTKQTSNSDNNTKLSKKPLSKESETIKQTSSNSKIITQTQDTKSRPQQTKQTSNSDNNTKLSKKHLSKESETIKQTSSNSKIITQTQDTKSRPQQTKQTSNSDNNTKLSKKPLSKDSKTITQTSSNRKIITQNSKTYKSKVLDTSLSEMIEDGSMNRTLRSRKIDLSSSLNSSLENSTNITIRSLRIRNKNGSSSFNNSTLEGNINVSKTKSQKSLNEKSITHLNRSCRQPKITHRTNIKRK